MRVWDINCHYQQILGSNKWSRWKCVFVEFKSKNLMLNECKQGEGCAKSRCLPASVMAKAFKWQPSLAIFTPQYFQTDSTLETMNGLEMSWYFPHPVSGQLSWAGIVTTWHVYILMRCLEHEGGALNINDVTRMHSLSALGIKLMFVPELLRASSLSISEHLWQDDNNNNNTAARLSRPGCCHSVSPH